MPPITAVAMDSSVVIKDIQDHNLRIVAERCGIDFTLLRGHFHEHFRQLSFHRSLGEAEFWGAIAARVNRKEMTQALRDGFLHAFEFREGAREFLQDCRDVRLFLWTNMPTKWVEAMDDQLGMDLIRFVNGTAIHWAKPEPKFFQYALDIQGLSADDVLYVSTHRSSLAASEPYTADRMLFQPGGFPSVRAKLREHGLLPASDAANVAV